jgi:hypothetical protein
MCDADHSSPSSAEVKNNGAMPPLPHTASWRGVQLIKYKDNFMPSIRKRHNYR